MSVGDRWAVVGNLAGALAPDSVEHSEGRLAAVGPGTDSDLIGVALIVPDSNPLSNQTAVVGFHSDFALDPDRPQTVGSAVGRIAVLHHPIGLSRRS